MSMLKDNTTKQKSPNKAQTAINKMSRTERYIFALKEAGISSDILMDVLDSLFKADSERHEKISGYRRKYIMIFISTVLVVAPLIPSINQVAASAIATLGAIGYGAALYDTYGQHAFKAGKSLRNLFR